MSVALDRFLEMRKHCEGCSKSRVVIPDQKKCEIRVECGCGSIWAWKLFSELKLKKRKPEGYCEKYFQNEFARDRLTAVLNGILDIEDEVAV